jgi:hypothetical protein
MRKRLLSSVMAVGLASALLTSGVAHAANLLSDGSFEALNIGTGNYTYPGLPFGTISPVGSTPVAGAWTYSGAALVNASGGSAWYGGSGPSGKDGVQFASLQGLSTITQSFKAQATTENLGWLSAGRSCCSGGAETYAVTLGGAQVGGSTFTTVGGSNFGFNSLALTGLTLGNTYTLGFEGLTAHDETAFLDNVVLQNAAFPAPPTAPTITRLSNIAHTDPGVPFDQHTVVDFDHLNATGFGFSGGYTRLGSLGLDPSVSAPPPGDLSNYETVLGGQSATFTSVSPLKSFSFFLGSPDSYNTVELLGAGGYDWTLHGDAIWGGVPPGNGDQSLGLRVRYDFGSNPVDKIIFSSSSNSFEFDTLAASVGVPEPATWAMMLVGFGALGAVLRRRRALALAA